MTLPEFEDKLLQIMNHTAQDLENASVAQAKTNVKGEIETLTQQLNSGNIQIPVDNLLPGNLGAEVDIAAGGAIFAAGARMDPEGIELTDAIPSESALPASQRGDWFTNRAVNVAPSIHSGLGFYNDDALNSRGISIRASGAAAGSKVGRVHISADNGDQNLAGATSAEIHLSSVNSGNAFINLIAETHVVDGALIVDSETAHFHDGIAVNNTLADINAGANVSGGLTATGGTTVGSGGLTITGNNGSWGVAVQSGTFYADNASIHQEGIQVNGALTDINAGANIAGGATITGQLTNQNGAIFNTGLQSNNALADINAGANVAGGLTVSGQTTINSGIIMNNGFESQGATAYVDSSLHIRGGSFGIFAPATLSPTVTTSESVLSAGAASPNNAHGLGTVPRYIFCQVRENTSSPWKPSAEGTAPGPNQFSIAVDSSFVHFNNNESVTTRFRVQYFE
jgi:hypothetical protein